MKKHIPNALTLLNLLCGCVALYFVFQNKMELVALFVFLGVCFDFFDGFAARILKVQSELGMKMDYWAYLNIDSSQSTSVFWLPTPANTLLILSLPLILLYQNNAFLAELILNPYFLLAVTLLSTFLLNARVRLFALKFANWGFKGNEIRYLFLILCVVLLITLKFLAIPVLIVCYVIMSLLGNGSEA